MDCNADSLAGPQATGVSFLPVVAGRAVMKEVGVYVDQRPYVSSSDMNTPSKPLSLNTGAAATAS